jgi:hypothetical protein
MAEAADANEREPRMKDDDREPVPPGVVRDLLLLCGVTVPAGIVAAQTPGDRDKAARWAAAEHLHASDNFGVKRAPKPDWVRLFEVLDADPDPCGTAVGRWAGHMARADERLSVVSPDESVTLELAAGAIMAQHIALLRAQERVTAALATVAAWARAPEATPPAQVIGQVLWELLGSDGALADFEAALAVQRGSGEGAAP